VGEQSLAIDGIVGVATASTPGREVADLIAAARARGRATAHG
jgi:hypothetical protein